MCCLNSWTYMLFYKFIHIWYHQSAHAPASSFAHTYIHVRALRLTFMIIIPCNNKTNIATSFWLYYIRIWVSMLAVQNKLVHIKCLLSRFWSFDLIYQAIYASRVPAALFLIGWSLYTYVHSLPYYWLPDLTYIHLYMSGYLLPCFRLIDHTYILIYMYVCCLYSGSHIFLHMWMFSVNYSP